MTENAFKDAEDVKALLGMLAGAASLCWEETPTSVFDSTQAESFVDQALKRLEELTESPFANTLHGDVRHVMFKWGIDKNANIPDHILSTFVLDCIKGVNTAVRRQNAFFGLQPFPDQSKELEE